MPPGVLFAVYDSETGMPEYIPPEHTDIYEFTPIDVSKMLGVTNKTIINRCAKLANNGFVVPIIVKERIRSYRLSDFTVQNEKQLLEAIFNQ